MNFEGLKKEVKKFINENNQILYEVSQNQSKALELAGTIGIAEHYKSNGYELNIINPKKEKDTFRVKVNTRGKPWDYSYIEVVNKDEIFCIYTNLSVASAHDDGIYCVDVGVVKDDSVPIKKDLNWISVDNNKLITFAEIKKLQIYPMLIAQFIGIVHEIKPIFLGGNKPRNFKKNNHIEPTLLSLGSFSANSKKIIGNFERRKFSINIYENFDIRLANYRGNNKKTPFYKDSHKKDAVKISG